MDEQDSLNEATHCEDSVFKSDEFAVYEREFKRYTDENLRGQSCHTDFLTELSDEAPLFQEKILQLAQWWREADRVVAFTGAGVSTASGLPDYRGPKGIWTRKLRGEKVSDDLGVDVRDFSPTLAHIALTRMHREGIVAHVVTTNVDGLHLSAGLPAEVLSQVHGNLFVEECAGCLRRFHRDFVVRTATGLFDHLTGRVCEDCGGPLRDTIVNFGNTVEHVPSMEAEHDRAWVECVKADLVVVFGSSLSVPSACDLPEECLVPRDSKLNGGRLVIVNLQRTPKDNLVSLRIFARCDEVLEALETQLA